uniref:palmitoyl-protein hydrolase n=1 Tax=Hucho hucho TaxID=62062 RepID=A0A4W5LU26_9TELE
MTDQRVALHVYDLSRGLARQMSASLLGTHIDGVWHTGVCVYGLEYFYGGGIQAVPPAQVAETYGTPYQVVELGTTQVAQTEFTSFLQEIQSRFTAATYNLLSNNCNNFSNEVANFLVGASIPQHILDLPQQVLSTPMGYEHPVAPQSVATLGSKCAVRSDQDLGELRADVHLVSTRASRRAHRGPSRHSQ